MKQAGMLVVSFSGVNYEVWYSFGWQYFSVANKVFFRVARKERNGSYFSVCVRMVSHLGKTNSLRHVQIGYPVGFNSNFLTSIPARPFPPLLHGSPPPWMGEGDGMGFDTERPKPKPSNSRKEVMNCQLCTSEVQEKITFPLALVNRYQN